MGYDLHIIKTDVQGQVYDETGNLLTPIALDEWEAAVAQVPGIRLSTDPTLLGQTPIGEDIRDNHAGGTVEIFLSAKGQWVNAIWYFDGQASFRASACVLGATDDPLWQAVIGLCQVLDARVVGDEGEFYDLETGGVS